MERVRVIKTAVLKNPETKLRLAADLPVHNRTVQAHINQVLCPLQPLSEAELSSLRVGICHELEPSAVKASDR